MDCCQGWTREQYHDDDCPWYNEMMDFLNEEADLDKRENDKY